MKNKCEDYLIYHKSNVEEIIDIGDIVMLDPATNTVTKAIANGLDEFILNSRMVIGVVIESDNYSSILSTIDGGPAKDAGTREEIDCGVSERKPQAIIIESGTSKQNKREIVKIAYNGECIVNICGFVKLGDKLIVSEHAGKAKALDYIDNDYFTSRTIGKVIKYITKYQVKVLLDIE